MSIGSQKLLDKIGVCASTICAVHCLLTGVAMGLLAVSGLGFIASPIFETAFIGIALIVGTWALIHGIRRHHSKIPGIVFLSGMGLIGASHLIGHSHDARSHASAPFGVICAVLGGLAVASFHFLNMKMQHRNCGCAVDKTLHGTKPSAS